MIRCSLWNIVGMRKTMKNRTINLSILLLIIMLPILSACSQTQVAEVATEEAPQEMTYAGKRIAIVDSYHEGYPWSDGIVAGVNSVLDETGAETLLIRLDTKNNTDDDFREDAARTAYEEITAFNPDVIIACDDNAQKYLIVPHLMDSEIPIVFCGVNWDASIYGYPNEHITGMVEIELIAELANYLESFAEGSSVAIVTGDTTTERKIYDTYNEDFFDGALTPYFVTTWEEYKIAYVEAQAEHDFLFARNNAGIEGWPEDENESIQFFLDNTTVPTGSINEWMIPYTLIILGKDANEQGVWSATTALSILDGTSVSDIPIANNRRGNLLLNLDMAEQLDIVFEPSLLRNAEIYQVSED